MTKEKVNRHRPGGASITSVRCNQCGETFSMEQFTCFDMASDSCLKERLLAGTFFKWTCPKCGSYSELAYPSWYLDKEAGLCVILRPGLETGKEEDSLDEMNKRLEGLSIPGTRYRAVGNFYAMQEQVRICEANLDDRVVQLIKPLIIGQLQSGGMEVWNGFFINKQQPEESMAQDGVIYLAENNDHVSAYEESVLWFDIYLTNGETLCQGINFKAYQLCRNQLYQRREEEDDGRFQLYDLSWAIEFHNGVR